MIKIAVCEDQKIHLNNLVDKLEHVFKELELDFTLYKFNSGKDLIENYPTDLDIIYLDIQMDDINGMDTARKIRIFDKDVEIIFITALKEYLKEGYEVRAYRYLIKPIKYKEILENTRKCLADRLENKKNIAIKDGGNTIIINVSDIEFIEVMGKETTIHMSDKKYVFKIPMRKIEKELDSTKFFKCHKSYIINMMKVIMVDDRKSICILSDGSEIPISRNKIKEFNLSLIETLKNII